METIRHSKPKARKTHVCNFCLGEISSGEIYEHQVNVYDGEFWIWKSHIRCSDIASKLKMYEDSIDGVTHDIFIETINDCYEVLKKESIGFTHQPFSERLEFVCNNFSTNP